MDFDVVYNEDCLTGMKKIPAGCVDAVICDLPYGTTRNKWDSAIPLDKLWEEYSRVLKPDGVVLLFAQCPFDKVLGCSNLKWLRYEWVWVKSRATGFLNAKMAPLKAHENILVFYRKKPKYNPQMTTGKPYRHVVVTNSSTYDELPGALLDNKGTRYPLDVQKFNSELNTEHPTQKPVDLVRYLVRTYTDRGQLVLDNCMGSGTTAVACILEGRHFIGFELDKHFCDITDKRIKQTRDTDGINNHTDEKSGTAST